MAYKIGETAVLIESSGQSVLIIDKLDFGADGTDSGSDFVTTAGGAIPSTFTLSDNFVFNYFRSPHQGASAGFMAGGAGGSTNKQGLDTFPFASDANATARDDTSSIERLRAGGNSSTTHGYVVGGNPGFLDTIFKFPFSGTGSYDATDVGNLTEGRQRAVGSSSLTHGYAASGAAPASSNVIDKFAFASDGDATDVGDLTEGKQTAAGQSSQVNGYVSGGNMPSISPTTNEIEKYPFASDANATDVGDITANRCKMSGTNSESRGYVHGGNTSNPNNTPILNIIDKFPFSTDANSTDVGDIISSRWDTTGVSSATHGYAVGGTTSAPGGNPGRTNIIEKYSFDTDGNSTDVGDLTETNYQSSPAQV